MPHMQHTVPPQSHSPPFRGAHLGGDGHEVAVVALPADGLRIVIRGGLGMPDVVEPLEVYWSVRFPEACARSCTASNGRPVHARGKGQGQGQGQQAQGQQQHRQQ
jgi:hypothetical protein